jgi:hypothetical protein
MSDDEIIHQRINGSSVRAIARSHGCAVTEVNAVIDRFADATIDDKTRKHSLALEQGSISCRRRSTPRLWAAMWQAARFVRRSSNAAA